MNTDTNHQQHDDEDPRPKGLQDKDLGWLPLGDYDQIHRASDIPATGLVKKNSDGTFSVYEVGEEHAIFFHNPNTGEPGKWQDGQEEER